MNLQSPGMRGLGWCGVAAVAVGGAFFLMSGNGGAQSTSAPSAPTQSSPPRFLEFDMPSDVSAVTAFIVGYFAPGEKAPAFAFEVPRSRVESTKSGSMRIPVVVGSLPAGQTYTIRLRTVAGGRQSAWSAPSGSFTVPADSASPADPAGTVVKNTPPRRSAGPRARKAAAAELEGNPDLQKRLGAAFPGLDLSQAAAGFRTVADLAAALSVSEKLKIPFAEIKKLTAEAGNRDLQKAIATLKPGVDAKAEARRARNEARRILRAPRK